MQVSMILCTETIENEVRQGCTQKSVALSYAMAIQSEARGHDAPVWPRINGAIEGRWGKKGVARVKQKAWRLIAQQGE